MAGSADQDRDRLALCGLRRANGAVDAWPSSPVPPLRGEESRGAPAPSTTGPLADQQRSRRSLLFYAGRLASLNAAIERLEQEAAERREQAARDAKAAADRYESEIARLRESLEASEAARHEQESRQAREIEALQLARRDGEAQGAQALRAAEEKIGTLGAELERLRAALDEKEAALQKALTQRLARDEDTSSLRRRLTVYETLKVEQEAAIRDQQARLALLEHNLQRHRAYFVAMGGHRRSLDYYFAEQTPWWKVAMKHPFALRHWRALRRVQRIKALT